MSHTLIGRLWIQNVSPDLLRPHKIPMYDDHRWEQWVYALPGDWRELANAEADEAGVVVEVQPYCFSAPTKRALRRSIRKWYKENPR